MQFLSYDMCSSVLSLKVIRIREWHSTYSERRDQTMRQLVTQKRLKTMENYKTIRSKVVTAPSLKRGSNHWALTRNRWPHMEAGRSREVVAH